MESVQLVVLDKGGCDWQERDGFGSRTIKGGCPLRGTPGDRRLAPRNGKEHSSSLDSESAGPGVA